MKTKQIQLTQNQVAIVDTADYERLSAFKWYARWNPRTRSFYAMRVSARIAGKRHTIQMHRELLGLKHGDKQQGDHINHDTLDNRRENLRVATHGDNMHNRRLNINNTSNFKGVYWNKTIRKWRAQIGIEGRHHHIGYFDNAEDAARAYDCGAIALHGKFASPNFFKSE